MGISCSLTLNLRLPNTNLFLEGFSWSFLQTPGNSSPGTRELMSNRFLYSVYHQVLGCKALKTSLARQSMTADSPVQPQTKSLVCNQHSWCVQNYQTPAPLHAQLSGLRPLNSNSGALLARPSCSLQYHCEARGEARSLQASGLFPNPALAHPHAIVVQVDPGFLCMLLLQELIGLHAALAGLLRLWP